MTLLAGGWTEEKHREQVSQYEAQHPAYELYAQLLREVLERAQKLLRVEGFVQARAKALHSFAEKIIRKREEYPDPIHDFTDLCGARMVTCMQAEADEMCRFVRENLVVDEGKREDVQERLRASEFGYLAVHYVVQMPWMGLLGTDQFQSILEDAGADEDSMSRSLGKIGGQEADRLMETAMRGAVGQGIDVSKCLSNVMPEEGAWILWESLRTVAEGSLGEEITDPVDVICRIGNRRAEIQAATMLQHVWAAVTHDRLYKGNFDPPEQLKRSLHRVAAQLEGSDADLARAIKAFDEYEQDYGAYMTREEIETEIAKWKAAARYDEGNVDLACKIARLAAAVEDWAGVIDTLEPHAPTERADVLRQLGRARSKAGQTAEGQEDLEKATEVDPDDGAAWYFLADTYCPESGVCPSSDAQRECSGREEAAELYRRAYRVAPSDPRALKRYLRCQICSEGRCQFLPLMEPALERSLSTCRRLARAGVRVPAVLYEMGLFNLLLDRPYESIGSYAKAVHLSESTAPIREALGELGSLRRGVKKAGSVPEWAGHLQPLTRFLELALVGKPLELARNARNQFVAREKAVKKQEKECERLHEEVEQKEQEAPTEENEGGGLRAQFQEAKKRLEELRDDLREAEERREETEKRAEDARTRFTEREDIEHEELEPPVVIVAGGCDARFEQDVLAYREMVVEAFRGYSGTIVSAGTTAGVGGIVGEVQERYGEAVKTVGYLPGCDLESLGVQKDGRYAETRRTEGKDFSVLDPLQTWTDIIASGIRPDSVRVLGINGGQIAGAEYRIAVALDAAVGLLEESGREAARLLPDEEWGRAQRLVELPAEEPILRTFLKSAGPWSGPGTGQKREELARKVHEAYREMREAEILAGEVSTNPWDDLPEGLKEDNRAQIDHAFEKLRRHGFQWEEVGTDRPITVLVFSEEEIEKLAEEEHARYVVERKLKGWRWGPQKDVENKINPYLVGWNRLLEPIKEYDRRAVRKLPEQLKEAGYEIHRKSP